jgi:hypothetical protein
MRIARSQIVKLYQLTMEDSEFQEYAFNGVDLTDEGTEEEYNAAVELWNRDTGRIYKLDSEGYIEHIDQV